MSASLRFLGFAVLAWAGVRAASLAVAPPVAPDAAHPANSARPALPPLAETRFDPPPPPDPVPMYAAYPPPAYGQGYSATYPPAYAYPRVERTIVVPASWPTGMAPPISRGDRAARWESEWAGLTPGGRSIDAPSASPWPRSAPVARQSGATSTALPPAPVRPPRFDRLQLTAWALLRGVGKGIIPTTSLASGGTLGASQAGARLTYRFSPSLAATLRSSSAVGGVRGAEVAAGIRWQPLQSIPVMLTAERRHGLGRFGGRSAFALFAEGGVYNRAIFNKLYLDGYIQGGVVGMRRRDLFIDGGATLTRPIWRNISGGVGVWGAAQPGLYRLDAGPRLTMQVRRGIKVHADYRQRLIGNAAPPSGPTVTLAADF